MSPQGFQAVPRHRAPTVLTVDSGTTGPLSRRFLTLVVDAYREWAGPGWDEPAHRTVLGAAAK